MTATAISYDRLFEYNVGILKQYTDDFYRLVRFPKLRKSGYEEISPKPKKVTTKQADEQTRLDNSISRSKSKVFELSMCNDWQYMVTVTQDPEKCTDRYNLSTLKAAHGNVIRNHNAYHDTDIKYMTIPEPHKDGAWHMHGLYMGIPLHELTPYTLDMKLPHRIRNKLLQGKAVYNWPLLSNKFGYVVVEPIESKKGCAGYITKYITKELAQTKVKPNEHLYYCSRGLNRAKVLYRNTLRGTFKPDFENDYISIKTYDTFDEAIQPFLDGELKQEDVTSWEENEPTEREHTTTTKSAACGITNSRSVAIRTAFRFAKRFTQKPNRKSKQRAMLSSRNLKPKNDP